MKLLTDRSLEIPMFLRRLPNGELEFPHAPVPLITAPVTSGVNLLEEAITRGKALDDIARAKILREQEATAAAKRTLKENERIAEKEAEKLRMSANFQQSRQEFLKHFKWEF